MNATLPYKGAGAIIYDSLNNSLVIVKGNQNIFSFPKGHLKKLETLEECASREVYEETGVFFSPSILQNCKSIVIYEYIYYIVVLKNGVNYMPFFNIIDTHEINTCKWYTIQEILTFLHNCNQGVKKIISNWCVYKKFIEAT